MQIYVNRMPIHGPWGGGAKFVNALYEHSHTYVHNVSLCKDPTNADALLIVGLDNDGSGISIEQALSLKKSQNRIVLRVNENDARKGTNTVDRRLINLSRFIDGTVFVSDWLKDYFQQRGWSCANNIVVKNGVEGELFKPNDKFNNGKTNIVAHHWSDNRHKGADIYERIDEFVGTDDRFTFTYIGRHKCNFKHTRVIPPLAGKTLGDELGKYDMYVSASRFDPGPNHITEAIACGLPTYVHRDGGGCVEFAGADHVYDDWTMLHDILMIGGKFPQNMTSTGSWKECVHKYVDFLIKN